MAAAEKEGVVSVYIFEAGPLTEETVQAFERAYPKIKVSQLRGRGNDLGPRLVAEKRAGKYIADLFAGGKGTAYTTLYVGKMLDPIKPLFLLPEVSMKVSGGAANSSTSIRKINTSLLTSAMPEAWKSTTTPMLSIQESSLPTGI